MTISSESDDQLAWEFRGRHLVLRWNNRMFWIPAALAARVRVLGGIGDPAEDLLLLDQRLRLGELRLRQAARKLRRLLDPQTHSTTETAGLAARRRQREAAVSYFRVEERRLALVGLVRELRSWVIGLDAPRGLLAEASAGWGRGSARPPWVTEMDDQGDQLRSAVLVRPRGARREGWLIGTGWRRDPDDLDPAVAHLHRVGPWAVIYRPETATVLGIRDAPHLPTAVWRLGSGHADEIATLGVLRALKDRMREPNSLILVAETLRELGDGRRSLSPPLRQLRAPANQFTF